MEHLKGFLQDKKFFFLLVSLLGKLLINIVFVFYVAANVSIFDFGIFSLGFIASSMAILFLDYGFNLKGLALTKKTPDEINNELSSMLNSKIFLLIILVISLFVYYVTTISYKDKSLVVLILILSSASFSFGGFYLNSFKIYNNFSKEAIGYIIQSLIAVLLLVINELLGLSNILIYAIILFIARTLFLIYGIINFRKYFFLKPYSFNLNKAIKSLKTSVHYGIHLILGALIIYVDTFMLSFLSNLESVGLYQAGMRIIMAAVLIAAILNDAFIPDISRTHYNKRIVTIKLSFLFEFILLFAGLVITTLFFYKKTIIKILISDEYLVLGDSIILMLSIIFLRYLGIIPGIILTSYDQQKTRSNAVIITLILSVLLNLLLIPSLGIKGAFYSSLLTHVVLNSIYLYFATKIIKFIKFRKIFKHLVLLIINIIFQSIFHVENVRTLVTTVILNLLILTFYFKLIKTK
jgi:O-antigen/teichoic acid export membrane protein